MLYKPAVMAGINSTYTYHKNLPIDLMKEYTICESFSSDSSVYAAVLEKPRSYGAMTGDFLAEQNLLPRGVTIMETGGGYGSLMYGLMSAHSDAVSRVFMMDLSSGLLNKQRQRLKPWHDRVTCVRGDIHELIPAITGIGLIIANEVIGDLDTMVDIDPENPPDQAASLIETYGLETPDSGRFSLNYGAIRFVEAICKKGIPAFITEHSCDPLIPDDMSYLARDLELDSFPRRINLYKHSEYTIRFSHLIKVARSLGRETRTGPLTDVIKLKGSPAFRTIFVTRACRTSRQEIIYELLDHIREYRWLIITP